MRGKKAFLARCLYASGATSALSLLRAAFAHDLPILTYHRIWDLNDAERYPYDLDLISASVAEFQWQMEYVGRHFTPITFATLARIVAGEVAAPRRPIIITLDDGFEDNFRLAFPILRSLGVPATLFVSTGYIGTNTTYWFDQLAHLVLTAPDGRLPIAGLDAPLELADLPSRRGAVQQVLAHTKMISNAKRVELVTDLHRRLGRDETNSATESSRPMTWDNVREMARAGIEIGSHTVRHPILTRLTGEEMQAELVESRRMIESQIGQTVTVLSYPVGESYAFNDDVCAASRAAGYRFAVSFVFGTNRLRSFNDFRLRRLPVERTMPRSRFVSLLQLPELLAP
ncbi:MAG: polysaccharide deacetylase family protein [Gemmatimonadaceae bacterium]